MKKIKDTFSHYRVVVPVDGSTVGTYVQYLVLFGSANLTYEIFKILILPVYRFLVR